MGPWRPQVAWNPERDRETSRAKGRFEESLVPSSTPVTNWSKWRGIHLLESAVYPVGSVGTLCRGDSVSFCNLATLPGRSFKGWGLRDVLLSDLLFFFLPT